MRTSERPQGASPRVGRTLPRWERPAPLKWAVDDRRLARLRTAWLTLDPTFREQVRLQALRDGKYLLQVLESKGVV